MATGARNQQTGQAGENFVAAELNRRGAYAVTFSGNMPNIDIIASNLEQTKTANIQVKTKRKGDWQTTTKLGKKQNRRPKETNFWVFVDLKDLDQLPDYYVVPDWWIRNDIYERHQEYIKRYKGKRKINPASTHHSINNRRIEKWKNRWDILKIF